MRIHLILTGGGTRGIYQIGALKAIEECGLLSDVVSISSCSIGSINASFISQYSLEETRDLWNEFTGLELFKNVDQYSKGYYFQLAKEVLFNDGLDINPFSIILSKYIDEDIIRSTDREISLSTFNITKKTLEYYTIDQIPQGQLIDYLLASSRLPFFRPVFINGDKYMDGAVGDNQPYYSALENKSYDMILKIRIMYIPYYFPGIAINNISAKREIEIKPSKYIGTAVGFRNPDFDAKYELGYEDALIQLKNHGLY